jgi:hypothetical protein
MKRKKRPLPAATVIATPTVTTSTTSKEISMTTHVAWRENVDAERMTKAASLGLLTLLEDVGAASEENLMNGVRWCDEQGATSIDDFMEDADMVEDFLKALSLKPIPAKKLRAKLTLGPTAFEHKI